MTVTEHGVTGSPVYTNGPGGQLTVVTDVSSAAGPTVRAADPLDGARLALPANDAPIPAG